MFEYNKNNVNVFMDEKKLDEKVIIKSHDKTYETSIKEDETGKYLNFKEKKIYLTELKPITLEYLLKRMRRGKTVSPMEVDQVFENVKCINVKCEFGNDRYLKVQYLGYDEAERSYQYQLEGEPLEIEDGIDMVGQTIKDYTLAYMLNIGLLRVA